MKTFGKIVLILLIACVVLSGIMVGLAAIYEDEIAALAVKQVNKHLKTQVQYSEVHLRIFKAFPLVSLQFEDVKMKEVNTQEGEELLALGGFGLQFRMTDMLRKNYTVRKLLLEDGSVKLKWLKDGQTNFDVWKSDSTAADTATVNFALAGITLRRVILSVAHQPKQYSIQADVRKMQASYVQENGQQQLATKLHSFLQRVSVGGTTYTIDKTFDLQTEINIAAATADEHLIRIEEGKVKLDKFVFDIAGEVNTGKQLTYAIEVESNKMDVVRLMQVLPSSMTGKLKPMKPVGTCKVKAHVEQTAQHATTAIEAKVEYRKGKLTLPAAKPLLLSDILVDATFSTPDITNPNMAKLSLTTINAKWEDSKIDGKAMLNGLAKSHITLSANTNLKVADVMNYIAFEDVTVHTGFLTANLTAEVSVDSLAALAALPILKNADVHINGELSNSEIRTQNGAVYSNLTASVEVDNQQVKLQNGTANINGTELQYTASADNLVDFLVDDLPLNLALKASAKQIDLNQLLHSYTQPQPKQPATAKQQPTALPLRLSGRVSAGELTYDKLQLSDLVLPFGFADNVLHIDDLKLQAAGGSMSGNLLLKNIAHQLHYTADVQAKNMNISDIFRSFDNFNGSVAGLTSANIKGNLSTHLQIAGVYVDSFSTKGMTVQAEVEVKKGELINYDMLNKLSTFIAVDELRHIRFEDIKNTFTFADNTLSFPEMEIRSSAINLFLNGSHKMDGVMDYHLKVELSELLGKKARSAKKENAEFGEIADDGYGHTSLFVKIGGTTQKPRFSYDTKANRRHIASKIKADGQLLKKTLKEDFSRKKDPEAQPTTTPATDPSDVFEVEWE